MPRVIEAVHICADPIALTLGASHLDLSRKRERFSGGLKVHLIGENIALLQVRNRPL